MDSETWATKCAVRTVLGMSVGVCAAAGAIVCYGGDGLLGMLAGRGLFGDSLVESVVAAGIGD